MKFNFDTNNYVSNICDNNDGFQDDDPDPDNDLYNVSCTLYAVCCTLYTANSTDLQVQSRRTPCF